MLPQPMTPSVLAKISTPMNLFFSHFPARVDVSASGICRASASISEMACSAVVMELPNGVFITITPAAVAAGMSTLSTPIPARPITLSFLAAFSTSAVILVAERMAMPSYWSTILINSSLARPVFTSASTPRSLKMATAAGDNLSAIRTLGMVLRVLWKGLIEGGALIEWQDQQQGGGCSGGIAAVDALHIEQDVGRGACRGLERLDQRGKIGAAFDSHQGTGLMRAVRRWRHHG